MRCAVLSLSFALTLAAATPAQPPDKVVPVHEEPRHRLVFYSPGTRILDIRIPPGDTTLFHTHSDPILYVVMSSSTMRNQQLGGEWNRPAGPPVVLSSPVAEDTGRRGSFMSTTSYAKEPLTHRVNNLGPTLYWLIGITNSSPGDGSAAPSPGFAGTPQIANNWFRGYRVPLPGPTAEHRHANPVAVVLTAGRATLTGGRARTLDTPGAFAWIEGDTPHTLAGTSAETEVVEVEVRRPR